jgi:hypothetical protein
LKKEYPDDFEQMGEAPIFGSMVAGALNFNGTSTAHSCGKVPDCEKVVNYIDRKNKGKLPSAQLICQARTTIFAVEQINDFNEFLRTLAVSMISLSSFDQLIQHKT